LFIHHKPHTSGARFNCSCTVSRQHLTTWHQESTMFIWNVHTKLYGQCTDTALCIDTRTNTKYCKLQQLTYSGYQEL
jgi:hypothetical protein